MNRILYFLAFIAGLAVVAWVGAGYIASNPLALAFTGLIAVVYVTGAFELQRYGQATQTLDKALDGLSQTPPSLSQWIATIDPALQDAVRARVEGERVGLPGPALTPYLVGLLVLLGMLGTFLGMVATLRGTGVALENATDLQAIRASLAAPITGLGFAFGTSVAGVATSAMLGLLSTLSRRDRAAAVRRLDAQAAGTLRVYSQAYQREESLRLLQEQTQALPLVVDRLQSLISAIETNNQVLGDKLIAGQEAFHAKSDARQTALEQRSEALNQRLASGHEMLLAKNEATLATLEQRAHQLNERLTAMAETSYEGLATSLDASLQSSLQKATQAAGASIAPVVEATLAGLAQQSKALQDSVRESVQQHLQQLAKNHEASAEKVSNHWAAALDQHKATSESLLQTQRQVIESMIAEQRQVAESLIEKTVASNQAVLKAQQELGAALVQEQRQANEALAGGLRSSLDSFTGTFEERSAALIENMTSQARNAAISLREALTSQDADRLTVWTQALEGVTETLHSQWQESSALAAQKQKEISDALATTAQEIATHSREHANSTIAEIQRLITAASEAPKLAAEVVAEVRDKLSDSMARDNAMLEERGRMLETLATLLDAVNHASNEQRTAVDALLGNSSELLERIEAKVATRVEAEAEKLGSIASSVGGSAEEITQLADTFGQAVQSFSESSATLMQHLQRVEDTLEKSIARSDEQLAYYVAQAREIVDLSLLSQKQILEQLQQVPRADGSKGIAAT